jgi:hypothetical protein
MTILVSIGRRVPRSWYRRQANKLKGLITFQENIWQMILQSMRLGKRKCNASGKGKWVMTFDKEIEDLNYQIEWIKIIIQGDAKFEEEEYNDTQKLYAPFGKLFKKDMPKDVNLGKHFKSKVLGIAKIDEAYKKGFGIIGDSSISNKLLEMGILTHTELIKDYDTREVDIKSDF